MAETATRPIRYSIEGGLKRALFEARRAMTLDELLHAVREMGRSDLTDEELRQRLEHALTSGSGAFLRTEDGWTLNRAAGSELNDLAYAYMAAGNQPVKLGDILRHLQTATHRSRGELMSRVDLDGDWRFARLENGEWVLTDRAVPGEGDLAAEDRKPEDRTSDNDRPEGEATAVAASATEQLVQETIRLIQEQLARLRQREDQISQEALACFHREDLAGIERLMGERRIVVHWIAKLEECAHSREGESSEAVATAP
ncbi:MAG: hypothetical protein QJR06_02515 [Alicyclobacillaceae bacterium]|nr:hypothetical protein [Alicyclobacillaceae bacterium]